MPTVESAPGRSYLVTGGSRGIGHAIAHTLVGEGAMVMITGRHGTTLAATAEELGDRCAWTVCHATDAIGAQACVRATVERFDRLDGLVNNVAINLQWGGVIDVDAPRAAKMSEVNAWAPVLWSRLVWDAWMREHGGTIVNVSSIGGSVVTPRTGFYNATKAALDHLTRALSVELAPGVRVNAVAPGLIDTDMADRIPDDQRADLSARIPLGRLGNPQDVADAVSFLLSDRASWITGVVLPVDGGTSHGGTGRDVGAEQ